MAETKSHIHEDEYVTTELSLCPDQQLQPLDSFSVTAGELSHDSP